MTTMFKLPFISRLFACLTLIMIATTGTLKAQNLETQMSMANKAWQAGQYDKCQALFDRIVTTYSSRAPMIYGPKFGVIHYRKGLSELKLANIAKRENDLTKAGDWFGRATESFKTCYETYPNGAAGMAKSTNSAHKASLQRWAEASLGMKKYKEAIELYKKFLAEREQRDKFMPSQGGFYVNLAICHFLLEAPEIANGIRHLETALKNKERMQTSDSAIVSGFLALSQAVIKEKNEQAILDFLNKNRASITLEPYQMYEFTPVFMKIAGDAVKAGMFTAAFSLYALIPGTEDVVADLKVRLDQLGDRTGIKDGNIILEAERLKKGLAKMKEKQRSGDPDDVNVLIAMTYLHDKAGNQRGVYGALEQLERYYKKSKKREKNLFSLVRASSIIGEIMTAEHYGSLFLKDFPESEKASDVRRLMLSSLFFSGKYEKSLEVAESIIKKVPENSKQHDVCLFVLGGSNFYLGNFEKAQPFIEEHIKTYPKSKLIMHSEYYQASNMVRLQYWEEAAKLLDAFIGKYPDREKNIYLPNALYDRANCHFSESQYEPALAIINRLEKEFSGSTIIDVSYNMKGNILESTSKFDEAEKYYKLALETAEKRGNKIVAGEALSYLVGAIGAETRDDKKNPRIKEALPWYDKFMKEYSDSPYKPQVVVYGMPAMSAAGRGQEALDNLQATITDLSGRENQNFLEECVNAFSEAFLEVKGNTPEKLKEFYYNFPGINLSNKKTLALLRIAVIGVYEEEIKKASAEKNDDLVMRYTSGINSLFRDLKSTFQPKELTNFVLLRIGDHLREKTSAPKQALPYYEELLTRDDKLGENKALLGIADVMGRSDNLADNKKALATLEQVITRAIDDATTQETALFRIIEINAKLGDWPNCEKKARQYLDEKFTKKTAEVSYLFALSFDKRGMDNDALFYYGTVYNVYRGFIRISAPAAKRVLEIMWKRNLTAGQKIGVGGKEIVLDIDDRQAAYQKIGVPYITTTRQIRETNKEITDAEKAMWDEVAALVKKYEATGQVKTMEEVRAEELEQRRRGRGN